MGSKPDACITLLGTSLKVEYTICWVLNISLAIFWVYPRLPNVFLPLWVVQLLHQNSTCRAQKTHVADVWIPTVKPKEYATSLHYMFIDMLHYFVVKRHFMLFWKVTKHEAPGPLYSRVFRSRAGEADSFQPLQAMWWTQVPKNDSTNSFCGMTNL